MGEFASSWLSGPLLGHAMDGYGPLRVPELRWLCEQRGLSPYGRKKELLARLEEQDQEDLVPHAECIAPGLEPFRELEQLAAELTQKFPAQVGGAVDSVPRVAPAQAKSAPAQPKAAKVFGLVGGSIHSPPLPLPQPDGVSDDERVLRGLLEFFACPDGEGELFKLKYRDFVRNVSEVLQPDLLPSTSSSSTAATAVASTAAAAACTMDVILRNGSNLKDQAVPGATNSKGTWSSEMWRKCMELIENRFQICQLQLRHDSLSEELESLNKKAMEKAEELQQAKEQLDRLQEQEAQQRQQLLGRARLQFEAWLEKTESDEAAVDG